MFASVSGGFTITAEDRAIISQQRAITKMVNDAFIQVGACFLGMSSKVPFDDDWFKATRGDTDLQTWIDAESHQLHNVGFNLQLGWVDVDLDSRDKDDGVIPEYNQCIIDAMDYLKVDTRFRFGRREAGVATHILVQLGEEEATNFDQLVKFEPKKFRMGGCGFHTQLRSHPMNIKAANIATQSKQTVMPGSVYTSRKDNGAYDLSVWYGKDGQLADNVTQIAGTTPRKVAYNDLLRAVAFGTFAYILRDEWVEGSRQVTAQKVTGWLARVVKDSAAMNNHEVISKDVYCPIDCDATAESLLYFLCERQGDEEGPMRVRAYYDARQKLDRNPDAKVPGWPAIEQLIGGESANGLRAVFMPGSDVSQLTKMAERYLYNESNNQYVDRVRHSAPSGRFEHAGDELERRHKGDVIRVGGKPKEAFRVYESSDMRERIDGIEFLPDLNPGGVFRIGYRGTIIPDDDNAKGLTIFNTWRGWPILPSERIDDERMTKCVAMLNQVLGYLTRDDARQIEWVKQWLAWTFQNPGSKQQIAWVCVGDQGVGKSFMGNRFVKALMGHLWGSASPQIIDGAFNIGPFKDKMFVFVDEAKFHSESGTDEIKKLIRNVDTPGQEKFVEAGNYRLFARIMFASNRMDMNIGQSNVTDRALFYTRTYDRQHLNMSEREFRAWSETLKPFFDEFDAMLNDHDVLGHYLYYFMNLESDRHQVESIKYSSSSDPEIVASNMSWSRRIAKHIIEEGRVYEDVAIEYPFSAGTLADRVAEASKQLGFRNVQPIRVLNEYRTLGLLEPMHWRGQHMFRFRHKLATLTSTFGELAGIEMEPSLVFTDDDHGDNTGEPPAVPPAFRGKRAFTAKF